MKLNKRAKMIIFVVFLIVFAYINYAFLYQPRNEKIMQLDQRISTLENEIAEGKRIAAQLNDLKREYAELTERLEFVEVLLPREKDIPDFLVLLQDTMDEFNIDFTNFSPQKLAQEQDAIYARLPINMTFNANYFETIKFLDRLENFPRIVDVRDLKLNPAGDDKETINVTMNMFTYVLRKGTQ
ncbi:MAG: type 4a pilus biogenesis protein PilO [Petrotogales bacterium]